MTDSGLSTWGRQRTADSLARSSMAAWTSAQTCRLGELRLGLMRMSASCHIVCTSPCHLYQGLFVCLQLYDRMRTHIDVHIGHARYDMQSFVVLHGEVAILLLLWADLLPTLAGPLGECHWNMRWRRTSAM